MTRARRLLGRAPAQPPAPAAGGDILLDDKYIAWLRLVCAGMQVEGNAYLFDMAMKEAPEAPMLEIGSFCGLSANTIQYLKRKHGRTTPLFTCDDWDFSGPEGELPEAAPVVQTDIGEYAAETYKRSVQALSDELPFTVRATSDQFFEAWAGRETVTDVFGREVELGGPLGFCFIDGNHEEKYALRDFQNCDAHLVPGGLILFDDSWDGSEWEVTSVIDRIKQDDKYEVVAKNPNYLMRKKA